MDPGTALPVVRERLVGRGPERLFVRDIGRGDPIVIVHGGPDFDHQYLLPELDRLAQSFHLVYYDQRGRGRSFSGDEPGEVTMATEVDDLDRVRCLDDFDTVAVLGHSWGGLVAMAYAIRHPDRLSHVILMNTAPATRAGALALRDELARRRSPAQSARMQELRSDPRFQAGDIETEAEYYSLHYGTTLRDPAGRDALVRRLRSAWTEAGIVVARRIEERLYEDTWSRDEYDLLPDLAQLEVPTLLLGRDHDFVPAKVVHDIAAAIPGSQLTMLPDCGHFAYLEQPDAACLAVTAFMLP